MGWAVVYRALLPVMQRSPNPLVRALVKRHGVAPTGAGGRMTWQDRLLAAFVAAVCAGALFGAAALGITLSDRWPLSSTPSMVVMGIGFVCMILGMMSSVTVLAHLVRAPFARSRRGPPREPAPCADVLPS
jgi:hypothetical protein